MRFLLILLLINLPGLLQAQSPVQQLVKAEKKLMAGDTTSGLETLKKILVTNPQNYAAIIRLTEIYYQLEDFPTASQYSFIGLDIIEEFEEKNEPKQGETLNEAELDVLKRIKNDKADLLYLQGMIRLSQGRGNDAMDNFESALKASPDHVKTIIAKASLLVDFGKVEESLDILTKATDRLSHYQLHFQLANLLYKIDQTDSALTQYEHTLELNPSFKWPYLYLAQIETQNQNYDLALVRLDQFIQLDSTSEEAYFRKAVLSAELGDWQNSIKNWDHVLRLNSNNAEAWRNKGLSYFRIEQYEKALDSFDSALSLEPDQPYTLINRGYCYYLNKQPKEALVDLDKGIDQMPKYYLGYYFRALTQLQLRKKKAACADIKKAISLGMNESEVDASLLKKCF